MITGAGEYVGGVVGDNDTPNPDGMKTTILQFCYNTGAVTGKGSVGGVAGDNQAGIVKNCVSLGETVTATEDSACVGRVAGDRKNGDRLAVNKARPDMKLYKNTSEPVEATSEADGLHGADVAVDNTVALSTVFSSADGWDTSVWTIPDGNLYDGGPLPTLKNAAQDPAPTLPGEAPASTVTGVTVTPATASVEKGKTQQFTAAVTGTNNPAQTVTWTVEGGVSGTAITADGLLTVDANETATTLTIKATSTVDSNKSGTATVTVTAVSYTHLTLPTIYSV